MSKLEDRVTLLQELPKSPPRAINNISTQAHESPPRLLSDLHSENDRNNKHYTKLEQRMIYELDNESEEEEPKPNWHDWLSLDATNGWEKEYKDAVHLATANNRGRLMLPNLIEKMEMGIKAATQRLSMGSLYPPEPVRSAELRYFEYTMEVKQSRSVHKTYYSIWSSISLSR